MCDCWNFISNCLGLNKREQYQRSPMLEEMYAEMRNSSNDTSKKINKNKKDLKNDEIDNKYKSIIEYYKIIKETKELNSVGGLYIYKSETPEIMLEIIDAYDKISLCKTDIKILKDELEELGGTISENVKSSKSVVDNQESNIKDMDSHNSFLERYEEFKKQNNH